MTRQLFVSIKPIDNDQQKIELDHDLPDWDYQTRHILGKVTANGVEYEAFVFSSTKVNRDAAKIAFVSVLDNPVIRKRTLGKYVQLPHDLYWNSIFILDNQQDTVRGTLNIRCNDEGIRIHTEEGKPRFVPFERNLFSLDDIMSVYQDAGYIFTEIPSSNPEQSTAFIGILITVNIDAMTLANSVSDYLFNLAGE